jgi:23S rRNA (uracil1939-C5)-methyltransferase
VRLTIEKLVYGGDGLARLTQPEEARAKTAFVPFVLPGEQVDASSVAEKPGFVRAALEAVVVPSAQRIAPLCPYFQRCGGCHYQHSGYDDQLAIKREILRETLERTAKIKWEGEIHLHVSPPWGYRNRTRMKVGDAPFRLGYHKHNSHDLLPIESCPISSPLINRAIAAVWEMGRGGAFAGYRLSEIEFFADHADEKLQVELYATKPKSKADWEDLIGKLRAHLPSVTSAAVFSIRTIPIKGKARKELEELQMEASFQPEPFIYKTHATGYQVSPGAFFQTNRFLVDRLLDLVSAGTRGKLALDLYAGVGLFSAALATSFERVEAVEIESASFSDLRSNVPSNVRVHRLTSADYLKTSAPKRPDLVVVDPPRAGLSGDVAGKLASLGARQVTYVSCDPATLARDLVAFLQSGYVLGEVHLVDLFPQTFHIESVVHLERKRSTA